MTNDPLRDGPIVLPPTAQTLLPDWMDGDRTFGPVPRRTKARAVYGHAVTTDAFTTRPLPGRRHRRD